MDYFDLHCDTIMDCALKEKPLLKNDLHIDLESADSLSRYTQCFAAWIPDELSPEEAYRHFLKLSDYLFQQVEENRERISFSPGKKCRAILTVENGSALGGKLERIEEFKRRGVKMLTLTWNGANQLGRGVLSQGNEGLTEFGKQALPLLEKAGIVVDVSHASPELFWEVQALAKKPFVASHSNAKSICSHPRNLADDQFEAIRRAGGLVGLNFFRGFLNDTPEKAGMEDILRHAEHFLSLGGEDTVAMGSDFDGARLPEDMEGLRSVSALRELFLRRNYSETLVQKLFWQNASDFFSRNGVLTDCEK